MISPGKSPRTQVQMYRDAASKARFNFRTGVSIHSHTHFSKENLSFIPQYASRIPWVAGCVRKTCDVYRIRTGIELDFSRAYWTPPLSPAQVWSSESERIENEFGMPALISITDHDNIDARSSVGRPLPVSMEWTIPYGTGYFHLGIHNIDPGQAVAIVAELQRYTANSSQHSASDLLSILHRSPSTLVVLNHPLWDVERSGREVHRAALQSFLREHCRFIHAIEINGFRPWEENLEVLQLGESWAMPVVAGGDRHGTVPNSVLNLSAADTIEEFVAEVREFGLSHVVLMPDYEESMLTKQLSTVGDAVRFYPAHPQASRQWTDRVFFTAQEGRTQTLTSHMVNGTPPWLRFVVMVLNGLGNRSFHRLFNAVWKKEEIALPDQEPRKTISSLPVPINVSLQPTFTEERGQQ